MLDASYQENLKLPTLNFFSKVIFSVMIDTNLGNFDATQQVAMVCKNTYESMTAYTRTHWSNNQYIIVIEKHFYVNFLKFHVYLGCNPLEKFK